MRARAFECAWCLTCHRLMMMHHSASCPRPRLLHLAVSAGAAAHSVQCMPPSCACQVAELERTLQERDAQMEALNSSSEQVSTNTGRGLVCTRDPGPYRWPRHVKHFQTTACMCFHLLSACMPHAPLHQPTRVGPPSSLIGALSPRAGRITLRCH